MAPDPTPRAAPHRPGLQRYLDDGLTAVQGWLEPLAVEAIICLAGAQERLGVTGGVAEIGVHHGKLVILLALLRRDAEAAVAIDLFEDQHLNVDASGLGDRAAFDANVEHWLDRPAGLIVRQGDSLTLTAPELTRTAGGPLRLISVDGGHTLAVAGHDLDVAADALAPAGLILLDDAFNEFFPNVTLALRDFLVRRPDFAAVGAAGNKTFITQTDQAGTYREVMAELGVALGLYQQRHPDYLGHPFHSLHPRELAAPVTSPRRQRLHDRVDGVVDAAVAARTRLRRAAGARRGMASG